ncbi:MULTISPECIES: hypothetical protein [Gordonia]|uniref:DUF5642 domain-containing protein n=1 Tax=Gordonia amicalis TaxID=89053 RepID=A0AAE4R867_9ACTN|nr:MULTISPECIES: hypothetical protein [Gordonia]ATD69434.1 hypothetical protein CNO18_03070 [Gordonia sp. 1D]MCZ4579969.1 hypothetical protein [Gordonia amicalis]MDJ0451833.1 hypothetical protein [Gordonia amicalis]MDV6313912.1 hypothetical protein [Gordonia amicalis]MDV7076095.1 hypothetical protein [Gordonia amicalis]
MRSPRGRHRSPRPVASAVFALVAAVIAIAGCSNGSAEAPAPRTPADLLLQPSDLPPGFTAESLSVSDLVAGNRAGIDAARTARVTPGFCTPTADAELNGELTADSSAVLAARGGTGVLVELVTEARRDIDADRLSTTGRCSRTTTEITVGNLAGSRVVTEYTEMAPPEVDGGLGTGEQMLLTRSEVTTTLPDGGVRRQIGFAGYAALDRPTSGPVTVQLTVSGATTPASDPPTEPTEPVDAATFVRVFDAAVGRVTAP